MTIIISKLAKNEFEISGLGKKFKRELKQAMPHTTISTCLPSCLIIRASIYL